MVPDVGPRWHPDDEVPPRPEEEIADAGEPAESDDDDAAQPGARGTSPAAPGRPVPYPPSPRPPDGPITSPSPEIADPAYRPPDYPTETSGEQSTEH